MPAGQCTTRPSRVPPKCEATCLVHWYGVFIASAQPTGYMAYVVGAADLVEPRVHVGHVVGDAVPDQVLADGALEPALARGAVVAEQVDEQGVVEHAELVERVDEPADLVVGVLGEAGVGLHQPDGHAPGGVVELVPVRHPVGPRRQLGVGRDDAELLLPGQDLLAHARPSPGRTGPRSARSTRCATWNGACVAPRAR